jgi:hypothetical protein
MGTRSRHPRAGDLRICCFALLLALVFPATASARAAKITGVISTESPSHVLAVWPNARVTLKNLGSGSELSTVSNDIGAYTFTGVLAGDYEITVTLSGFEQSAKRVTVKGGDAAVVDFQLSIKKATETVKVTAEPAGVDVSSTSDTSPTLTTDTLKSVIRLNQDFQDALPLLPGVMRGPDGLIRIKGGRVNQSSTLVNNASVVDPFNGQPALKLPSVAVQSMRVLSNPFSAEYGKFASGVVEVTTRGGTDEWKYLFEDPIPRFRWINGHIHGVESASPHFTFAGPIKRGKLYLFQSMAYGYDTVRVPSLPDPNNVHVEETASTYTQLDWIATPNHQFTAVLIADPRNTDFVNLDTFNPQPVTADYHQRSFFTSATHRWILPNGGFVQSLFSLKRLDPRVFPADNAFNQMTLYPEQNSGSYFEQQNRRTRLYQWAQTLHLWPLERAGRHLISIGYSYARSTYEGAVSNLSVNVFREDHTLSSAISYPKGFLSSQATSNDVSVFVQDNWQIHPRLTVDLGVRVDNDSLSSDTADVAPRVGFVFAPTRDNRTAIRGGWGIFYDKIPINVAVFSRLPAQTITNYAPDGTNIIDGPATFAHVLAPGASGLRVPYSYGWSFQFDRELHRNLLFRFGYEERAGHRDFYVNPFQSGETSELRLYNTGKQSYREFLWMVRWKPVERTTMYASYVRARAQGDLNDYNQFFDNISNPLIRPNQYGPLVSDAPNRVLFWGIFGLPYKFDFVPVLDVHTGFPYSKLDQNWNYIGQRNEAGRFPTFIGLDTKIQYPFDFKFHGHRFQFSAALSVLNVLNHYNPRDVQQNITSPNFGNFYNSVGRLWRIDGGFDF